MTQPFRLKHLLTMILNMYLLAKDIPTSEKLSIVTPLPKKGTHHTTLDNIRPISVGPFLSRLFNSILARRLSTKLEHHKILDQAQHAFLPGKGIHEAINSITTALRHFKENPTQGEGCFLILYDISKAYDNLPWSSIERGLERLGIGPNFIDLVMNTHKGTELAMKLNPRRATLPQTMFKGIKQGCPLAPLLFIIVMDELHCGLRQLGGYEIPSYEPHSTTTTKVSSRGFCDDVAAIANSITSLHSMNQFVRSFLLFHNFTLNRTKTHATGRFNNGCPLNSPIPWDDTSHISPQDPQTATRYLGLQLSFDLTWNDQIKVMNSIVAIFASQLQSSRLTPLQATSVYKQIIAARLEIGYRHATIPTKTLTQWDHWISRSFLRCMDLQHTQISIPSLFTTLNTLPPSMHHKIALSMHTLESLTKNSELQTSYWHKSVPIFQEIKNVIGNIFTNHQQNPINHTSYIPFLSSPCPFTRGAYALISIGCLPENNSKSFLNSPTPGPVKINPNDPSNQGGMLHAHSSNHDIPFRDTITPWSNTTHHHKDSPPLMICTDGSTNPTNTARSGVGITILEDNYRDRELWGFQGFSFTIPHHDNFIAEMAAINKALHTPSIEQDLIIWTDSKSSMDLISTSRHHIPKALRCSARPYLYSTLHILNLRDATGANTTILHVPSHTGAHSRRAIGNADADHKAKTATQDQNPTHDSRHHMDLAHFELPIILHNMIFNSLSPDPSQVITFSPIYGDLRAALTSNLQKILLKDWTKLPARGAIPNLSQRATKTFIDRMWSSPSSENIRFSLTLLNNYAPKAVNLCLPLNQQEDQKMTPSPLFTYPTCTQCALSLPASAAHTYLTCPANADIYNNMDSSISHDLNHHPRSPKDNPLKKMTNLILNTFPTGPGTYLCPLTNITHPTLPPSLRSYPRFIPTEDLRHLIYDLLMTHPRLLGGEPYAINYPLPNPPIPASPPTHIPPTPNLISSHTSPAYPTFPMSHISSSTSLNLTRHRLPPTYQDPQGHKFTQPSHSNCPHPTHP